MVKGYVHVEITTEQSPKKPGTPCGDVLLYDRTTSATTIILSDGLGSGIKASIAATICASRLLELLRRGFSLRSAVTNIIKTMNKAKDKNLPYAVFTVIRILNDGDATVITYEMPPPLFIAGRIANILKQRKIIIDTEIAGEANCYVEPGDGIIVVSDGITMAGIGLSIKRGWQIEGVCNYINKSLSKGISIYDIPGQIHRHGRRLWEEEGGDDCTAALAFCRKGEIVNILTGPPEDKRDDIKTVNRFIHSEGNRIVCGASTASMVAKVSGKTVTIDEDSCSELSPPKYYIEGIDLVTEGAITLNQVYNIIDEDEAYYEQDSAVTELCEHLKSSDRINFFVGKAKNPGHSHMAFQQKGVLPRHKIVPLLGEKLEKSGKLVVIEYV